MKADFDQPYRIQHTAYLGSLEVGPLEILYIYERSKARLQSTSLESRSLPLVTTQPSILNSVDIINMASAELVLITGATGFLGSAVLREALKAGYRVRAAVRSAAKAETVRLRSRASEDQLAFVIVPDFLAKGAFDEAVQGVDAVIHVASPTPKGWVEEADAEDTFIRPAVEATLGIFESVRNAGKSVRRVVVTSSMAAIIPLNALAMESIPDVFTADDRQEVPQPPYHHPQVAYRAGKIAALNGAEDWVKDKGSELSFDAIHILPAFVFGRDETAETAADVQSSTNVIPLRLALGQWDEGMQTVPYAIAHVDDTAKVHVLALGKEVPGNQRFLVSNDGREGGSWEDLRAIVEKTYPDAVAKGVFKKEGRVYNTIVSNVDKEKTETTLNIKLASPTTAIQSVLDQYLELLEK